MAAIPNRAQIVTKIANNQTSELNKAIAEIEKIVYQAMELPLPMPILAKLSRPVRDQIVERLKSLAWRVNLFKIDNDGKETSELLEIPTIE